MKFRSLEIKTESEKRGIFGTASKQNRVLDICFSVDCRSHLGTRCDGMILYDKEHGFQHQGRGTENTLISYKIGKVLPGSSGCGGIDCISDTNSHPLLVCSHSCLPAVL